MSVWKPQIMFLLINCVAFVVKNPNQVAKYNLGKKLINDAYFYSNQFWNVRWELKADWLCCGLGWDMQRIDASNVCEF